MQCHQFFKLLFLIKNPKVSFKSQRKSCDSGLLFYGEVQVGKKSARCALAFLCIKDVPS